MLSAWIFKLVRRWINWRLMRAIKVVLSYQKEYKLKTIVLDSDGRIGLSHHALLDEYQQLSSLDGELTPMREELN